MKMKSNMLMIAGLILILVYQNCSPLQPVRFSDASADKVTNNDDSNGDNGRPYDGKIYLLTGDFCPDGTKIRGRIILQNSTSADLVRENCNEIAPVLLTSSEFQLSTTNPNELIYKSQSFLNQLIGTKLDVSPFYNDGGFAWLSIVDFPSVPDTDANRTASTLQIYEDGMPLGPAHALHVDVRNLGAGRFSHYNGGMATTLRFSTSDNSDPHTNGRTYTWTVR